MPADPRPPGRSGMMSGSRSYRNPSEVNPDVSATAVPTNHKELVSWVEEVANLTQPDAVHWCDGSSEEYDALC